MSKFEGPKSSIDHIEVFGADEAKADELRHLGQEHYAERFANQDVEGLREYERKLKPEELEIVGLVNRLTNKVMNRHGLPDFDIPSANVHPIIGPKWKEFCRKNEMPIEDAVAGHSANAQAVFFRDTDSKFSLASSLAHEIYHFKDYRSLNVTYNSASDEIEKNETRRNGLTVGTVSGAKLFGLLNEALKSELQKRAMVELRQDPMFADEVAEIAAVAPKFPELPSDEITKVSKVGGRYSCLRLGYVKPRAVLNRIIDRIAQDNPGFRDREEVFDAFVKTSLTGIMEVPLGRFVDEVYGPGTFKRLGACQTEAELEEFAKSLKT